MLILQGFRQKFGLGVIRECVGRVFWCLLGVLRKRWEITKFTYRSSFTYTGSWAILIEPHVSSPHKYFAGQGDRRMVPGLTEVWIQGGLKNK